MTISKWYRDTPVLIRTIYHSGENGMLVDMRLTTLLITQFTQAWPTQIRKSCRAEHPTRHAVPAALQEFPILTTHNGCSQALLGCMLKSSSIAFLTPTDKSYKLECGAAVACWDWITGATGSTTPLPLATTPESHKHNSSLSISKTLGAIHA